MMKKSLIPLTIALAVAFQAAATSYDTLRLKASRFFDQREWPSAQAMLELMLDQRPDQANTYGQAIVAAAMNTDSVAQISLMRRSMLNYVPFDSTFAQVKAVSFSLGLTDLYERFLLMVKDNEPWLSRTIDAYLLDYYTFRRDPELMIRYAQVMLQGMPSDTSFLAILAQGYMLSGDTHRAMETYRRILDIDPANYDALLQIGNQAYISWNTDRSDPSRLTAIDALSRAYALKPTPYVAKTLSDLNSR